MTKQRREDATHVTNAELSTALLEKTREGRLQDWNERIGAIAKAAGLRTEYIAWQGKPVNIAFNVVEAAAAVDAANANAGKIDALKRAIENFKAA